MMQEVLLSSICDLKNGFAFKSKDYVDSSNTLSCRMSSIRPGGNFDLQHNQRFLPDTYAELYSDYLLNDGDIVIAMTDLAGDPKILGVPTIVNTGGKKLLQNQRVGKLVITDSSKVFIPYLQYALNRPSNKSYYKKFAGGGLQINVSKKDILNNSVPLPPLDQQKKIATILDAADAYRQKTKALIEKYDELTQSLFLDMFGDPVTNSKGWEFKSLNKLVSKLGDGIHGTPQYSDDGDYYFVNGNNLQQGKIVFDHNTKRVSYEEHLKHKKDLGDNTVLVSINGTIGKVAFYNNEPIMLGKSACYFNLTEGAINKSFLYHVIYSPYFIRYASNQATGSTIKNVSLKSMRNFPIPYPPLELQNQFADRVQAIEAQKAQAQASLIQAKDLFNSLLQKAFKGELV